MGEMKKSTVKSYYSEDRSRKYRLCESLFYWNLSNSFMWVIYERSKKGENVRKKRKVKKGREQK